MRLLIQILYVVLNKLFLTPISLWRQVLNERFILFENQGNATGDINHSYGSTINDWNIATLDHDYIDLNNDGYLNLILAGCEEYRVFINGTKSLGVIDFTNTNLASIYPNPTRGLVNISLENLDTNSLQIQLYTVSGSLIFDTITDFTSNKISQLDVCFIKESGIYFLKLTTPDGDSISQKLIVE